MKSSFGKCPPPKAQSAVAVRLRLPSLLPFPSQPLLVFVRFSPLPSPLTHSEPTGLLTHSKPTGLQTPTLTQLDCTVARLPYLGHVQRR